MRPGFECDINKIVFEFGMISNYLSFECGTVSNLTWFWMWNGMVSNLTWFRMWHGFEFGIVSNI